MKGQGPLNSLKPQPGQTNLEEKTYHPLPGPWAQKQLNNPQASDSYSTPRNQKTSSSDQTPLQKALAAESSQHEYWQKWQGVTSGKPAYEDPRAFQNTLLPVAKYGTEGR